MPRRTPNENKIPGELMGAQPDHTTVSPLIPPDTFVWNNATCTNLSAAQYRLLAALTDGPRLRDFVPFADLAALVWAGRIPPRDHVAAIKELTARLGDKFRLAGVRLLFDRKRHRLRLLPF